MVFKQETVKSWFTGIKTSVNNEVIQPFQNAEQVIWKYNQAIQHNSLTQKGWERLLAQSDDGLKAYLTNIKGTTASMTGYTVSLQGNITGFKKVSSAITQYNALATAGTQKQNEFSTAVATTNGHLGGYLRGLGGAKASLGGYVNSLVSATAKTIVLQAATMALNAAVSMGITAAISLAVKGFDKLINSAKRASDAANEAFSESNSKVQQNKEEIKTLDELIQKYKELRKNENLDTDGRKQVKNLQNDIANLVGTQAQNLDLVNGKLDEEISKLDEISTKQAKNAYDIAGANYRNAVKANEKASGNSSIAFVDGYAYVGDRNKEAEKILQDAGFINYYMRGGRKQVGGRGVGNNGFSTIIFDTYDRDGNLLKGAQEKLDYLKSMVDVLEQMGQGQSELHDGLLNQIAIYQSYIDNQKNAADSLIDSWITYGQYANEELSKINVDSVESFEQYRQKMIEAAKDDESIGQVLSDGTLSEESLEIAINDFMSTATQFSEWYEQWAGNVKGDTFNDKYTIPSISDTIDQLNTQLKPAFDSLKSAYQDIFTDDGFTLENVDLSMLDSIRSSIEELNSMEDVDINIDYSSFENLATVLTDTTSTEDEVQEAINSLATDIVSALNPAISECSGEAYQMVQSLLESVGVMNSEEVMVSALGYTYEEYIAAKQECADAGFSLANATESEISAFINEQGGAENCGVALATLQLKKLLVNNTTISTVSDVNQILSLASAANISANSLVALANAKAQFETASQNNDKQGMALAARGMKEASEKAKKDILNYKPVEVDFAPKGGSGGGGGSKKDKDTTEEFDWIEKKIENLEEDLSRLDKVANSSYSSIAEKNEALAESIEKINEEIDFQQQAYERYMQKAESVGLSDEYKNLVQNGAINIEEITDEDLKEAIKNYEQWYKKAKETQDKINDLHVDAKDKHVASYELAVSELEKLRESQALTEREYLDSMLDLYEKYYADQTEFANQAKEAKLKYLSEEKEYLETVANAAASLLDDKLDGLEDDKDKARKIYDDQIAGIEDTIKAREKEKDAIQIKIDALKDEGDELDRQKNLLDAIKNKQEALAALERAKNQRNKLLYKDGQMIWAADDSAIKEADQNIADAQNAVDKAQRDIAIADLQLQIDAIDAGIDALEDEKARLEALGDESDAYFDKKIADLKEYQNEWKKALEIEERAIAVENLKSMFGEDAVEQVLAHNMTLLSTWKQDYVDTMAAIDLAGSGFIGKITSQWGELAGISVDMDNAMQLSGLSIDALTGKVTDVGTAISETADAAGRVGEALVMADTSIVSEQFRNIGLSAQETQAQISGVTEKLNTLASDVQSYTIPAINTEQFTASLGTAEGTNGILGDLNAFVERFREICGSIPSIWTNTMSSLGGQGGVTNGESVSCGYLFQPLLNAMDAAKLEIDAKLQEYTGAWTQFHTDLGSIIGVESGAGADAVSGKAGSGILKSPLSAQKNEKQAGADTIVGTIESGGEASVDALNNTWIPGFEGFASSIDSICASICSMVEDMTNDVIDMANKALKAMKEVEAKNTGAYKLEKAGSGYSSHAVSSAHVDGTPAFANGKGAITKDQTSLVNELGNEGLVRDGVLHEIQGGAQEIRLKKGDIIFNHKQMEELKKHDRVTSNGGHGKLIGSFAGGTAGNTKVSILDDQIRDMWNSEEFMGLLGNVEKLKNGQAIVIGQMNTILKDKNGNPYREGTIITPKGDVYTPLPEDHPGIQIQKSFEAYIKKMGGVEFLTANALAQHEKQMGNMVKQIINSNVVTNNNVQQPAINVGDIHITCPGVTDQHVVKQIGMELEHRFTGLIAMAYQESHKSR